MNAAFQTLSPSRPAPARTIPATLTRHGVVKTLCKPFPCICKPVKSLLNPALEVTNG